MEQKVSELFISIIMSPASYPRCFGANTNVAGTLTRVGMDIRTVANAFGQFLAHGQLNILYILGKDETWADPFFTDLQNALCFEDEIRFSSNPDINTNSGKWIIRITDKSMIRAEQGTFKCLEISMSLTYLQYVHFTRDDLAAFIYSGNTHDGPIERFTCAAENGILCKETREHCGVCFNYNIAPNKRLEPVYTFYRSYTEYVDEGIVAEPLGIPDYFYRDHTWPSDDSESSESDTNFEFN